MSVRHRIIATTIVAAAVGMLGVASTASASTVTATPAQNTAALERHDAQGSTLRLARAVAKAWNTNDAAGLASLFTKDGIYIDYAIGRTMHGRDQIAAWESGTHQLISNVHIQDLNAFGDRDYVAIESIYSGHIQGAPKPFAVNLTSVIELSHGKVASNKDYYNLAAVLAQSGLPANWTPPTA
jgi:steroid delta-isomerase-like uncharacterized protein